jgi:hypothetical protein
MGGALKDGSSNPSAYGTAARTVVAGKKTIARALTRSERPMWPTFLFERPAIAGEIEWFITSPI